MGGGRLILVDTHALLWWQAGGDRLSAPARRTIDRADTVLVAAISFWEVGMLVGKGRVALDRDPYVWARDLLADERVDLAPLTPTAGIGAALLPDEGFEGDPADGMVYATARELNIPLVTKDERMHAFAAAAKGLSVVW